MKMPPPPPPLWFEFENIRGNPGCLHLGAVVCFTIGAEGTAVVLDHGAKLVLSVRDGERLREAHRAVLDYKHGGYDAHVWRRKI